ncbi:hypothetical protein FS935_22270 [Metabacillus litoralis]|uniref:Uncharacterized protein n=1 Tax=Metabacillus litoralis TaxID=152268 RepID=A0A5C6V2D7_9BACI|nr:hypothetical protein [Metabacillus litoralis]TXC79020.1 hypothetical protein FS935_22270 [Metabacillus litoralis]
MEEVDFSPLKSTLNNIAFQFIIWMAICIGSYAIAFTILRIIKVPDKIAHLIATAIFLIAMNYSFVNGYIPGIEGAQ